MPSQPPIKHATNAEASDEATPRYRSGAVARMVQMPVATLRIWERRYGVVRPATSASGHRLYSAGDVRRLVQLKQLTETGHAIGSIAALDEDELRQVAATHATSLPSRGGGVRSRPGPWRVVVVGQALALRLRRPALLQRVGRVVRVVGVHDDLAQAAAAGGVDAVDALLMQAPQLGPGTLAQVRAAMVACDARIGALLYGYGAAAVCDAIADAGIVLLREAQDDRALAVWLRSLAGTSEPGAALASTGLPVELDEIAPRRYDDAALTDFAGLSSTIACECPKHVAELLIQLSHFEAYSADCQSQSPADASLHDYLRRIAGQARALFESALERVAIEEGLMLPR